MMTMWSREVSPHRPTQQFLAACRNTGATQAQIDRLNETDLIIRALKGTDSASNPVYIAVEVANQLDDDDVRRVGESTQILGNLVPGSNDPTAEVIGAVYGVTISEADRGLARDRGVEVFVEPLPR